MAAAFHATAVLVLLVGGFCVVLAMMVRRYPGAINKVVDAIDAQLPQTQCAQCGYPGCRPYAEAVAGGAPIDLCPPGGDALQNTLAQLLGRSTGSSLGTAKPVKARIQEELCIGCFLCIEACPVDAIVGAPGFAHTVIEQRCTGCELCVAPCPVDCIDLKALTDTRRAPMPASPLPCIRCNRCEPVCPESLAPQILWWVGRSLDATGSATALGVLDCIECGLCNQVCPSDIDLAGTFHAMKQQIEHDIRQQHSAAVALQHYEQHNERLAEEALIASDRRQQRLADPSASRSW